MQNTIRAAPNGAAPISDFEDTYKVQQDRLHDVEPGRASVTVNVELLAEGGGVRLIAHGKAAECGQRCVAADVTKLKHQENQSLLTPAATVLRSSSGFRLPCFAERGYWNQLHPDGVHLRSHASVAVVQKVGKSFKRIQ